MECDGKRDRVAYVSLKQMNTGNLVSDIRFLEEIEASSGGAKRHLDFPKFDGTKLIQWSIKSIWITFRQWFCIVVIWTTTIFAITLSCQ